MTSLLRGLTEKRWVMAALAVGLVVAVLAAFTSPFTRGAEVITALPLAVGLLVVILRVRSDRSAAAAGPSEPGAAPDPRRRRWAFGWLFLAATIVGWELYCYLSEPRSAHPTLSVLIDLLDATPGGKFVGFLLWLTLGWVLVVR